MTSTKNSPQRTQPFSLTTKLVIDELNRRSVSFVILNSGDKYTLISYTDTTGNERLLRGVITDTTNAVGVRIADNKLDTYHIVRKLDILAPTTYLYKPTDAFDLANKSWVVKPIDSAHGNGITTNVTTKAELQKSIALAQQFSNTVLIQEYIPSSHEARLLYIDRVFVAAIQRVPATVTGDGQHTVAQLIDIENNSNDRRPNYTGKLCTIPKATALDFLQDKANYIPPKDEPVQVVGTANIGTGGYGVNITDQVPPSLIDSGKTLVDYVGLDVCAIDFIKGNDDKYYLLEINASPSLFIHHTVQEGKPIDVTTRFVDMILRPRSN